MKIQIQTTLAALLLLGVASLHAQLPVSKTDGVLQTTIYGGSTTIVGVPFFKSTKRAEVVSTSVAAGETTITVDTGLFTGDDFVTTPHSVAIKTAIGGGTIGSDFPVTANTANSVTVTGTGLGLTAGDQIDVIEDWTMDKLFGANTPGFTANSNPANADLIKAVSNGTITSFYYSPATAFPPAPAQWEALGGGPNDGNLRIDPHSALEITRQAGADITFTFNGEVKTGTQVLPINDSSALVSLPTTLPVTLVETGLQDVLNINSNPANADLVKVTNASGNTDIYYYSPATAFPPAPAQWLKFGGGPSDSVVLPSGAGIQISRSGGATSLSFSEVFTD